MVGSLLAATSVAFALSSVLHVLAMLRYRQEPRRWGMWLLVLATGGLGAATSVEFAADPGALRTGPRVMMLVLLGVCVLHLGLRGWRNSPIYGLVMAPLGAVVSMVVLVKVYAVVPQDTSAMGIVTALHIGAALLGFMLFVPAYVLSVLFLDQQYRLKTKQLTGTRLPSLLSLEDRSWRLLFIGFPLYSVAILLGAVWQESTAGLSLQPQHILAGLSWLAYAVAIYRRVTTGWRGRQAALMVIAAFLGAFGAVLLYGMR